MRLPAAIGEPQHDSGGEPAASVHRRRILIVEDNPDVADVLAATLQTQGHDVEIAYDGSEGLERARQFGPDAIICDLGLPDIDGFELARTLRENPAFEDTILIALSGYAASDDVEKSRAAGFDHHQAKPPDIEELERLIAGPDGEKG